VGPPLEEEAHQAALIEGKRRVENMVPPGFKDKGKDDVQAAGDYILWEQILREAEQRRCDVLLVTADVKEDWWRRDGGQTKGPRLELIDELRRRAGVRLLMVQPVRMLELAKQFLEIEVQDQSVRDIGRVDKFPLIVQDEELVDSDAADSEPIDADADASSISVDAWDWEAYSSKLGVSQRKIRIAQVLVERLQSAIASAGLPWRPRFTKYYIAFRRRGGNNVLSVHLRWYFGYSVRLAVRLPDDPLSLGVMDPFPNLNASWSDAKHEWYCAVPSIRGIPDVEQLVQIAAEFNA
jgi:hypothetical protein